MMQKWIEMITLLIALISFFMSAATWVRELWLRRSRIDLSVIDYNCWHAGNIQFYLLLHNRSTIPASVSHIALSIDGVKLTCTLEPMHIKDTLAGYRVDSPFFPLNLPPQAFSAYYIEFPNRQGIAAAAGKTVVFEVCTSRGTTRKTISLPPEGHYFHRK